MRSDIVLGRRWTTWSPIWSWPTTCPEPSVLLADRGYASDSIRKTMEARSVVPVILARKTRKLRLAVDRIHYRLRNLVERCFRTPAWWPPATKDRREFSRYQYGLDRSVA